MRSLSELLRSPAGRRILESRSITDAPAEFAARVGGLARPVYVGHQVFPDFRRSVVAKFMTLRDIAAAGNVSPAVLWSDTDRAGSDQASMSIAWRDGAGGVTARLAPHRFRDREIRFVPVEDERTRAAFERLRSWARALRPDAAGSAAERLASLEQVARASQTLAEANRAIAEALLTDHIELRATSHAASELLARESVRAAVAEVVGAVDDVILVFNNAVEDLRTMDVDPQVSPLDETYLPLFFSCPRDGMRRRLRRERAGADRRAAAACRCGAAYRFHLGDGEASIDELAATGRWSVDVTLPLYVNDVMGGVVAGRSSALYGMVLNEVLEKVLGRTPIPVLVPAGLPEIMENPPEPDSLLRDYLTAP